MSDSNTRKQAPYGTWSSPVTTDLMVAQTIAVGAPQVVAGSTYWVESRPQEAGRTVIVRDGEDMLSEPYSARSRVHEYGGGGYLAAEDALYFTHFLNQQIYQLSGNGEPTALTDSKGMRFADYCLDKAHQRLISVVEDHTESGEPVNFLAAVDLNDGTVTTITSGHDFYATPRINADGSALVWITWDHPNMPWDATTLWQAEIRADGSLSAPQQLAGNGHESVLQPAFSPSGMLFYISDRNGYWNIYQQQTGEDRCLVAMEAEFGGPQWAFGQSYYGFIDDTRIVCSYSVNNLSHLGIIDIATGELKDIPLPFSSISSVQVGKSEVVFVGASPQLFSAIVRYDLENNRYEIIKKSSELELDQQTISMGEPVTFPTADDQVAHAFYYPPQNAEYEALPGELPPLLVKIHGGPTGATHSDLNLQNQFWTSRGIAVLDVNYRGSTGYGRHYRQQLNGNWGITDVEDTAHGAAYLVDQQLADGDRLAIRGGSAGGYTTLAALTFDNVFKAGASYYGVSDLEILARDTHKFESRYLDSMVGPYPEDQEKYQARSPIHHVDGLSCPVIFFQGLDDKVVPPNQAEMMVDVLREKGLPVAYVPFEGEGHGFRMAKNIKRSLDLELYFYGRIFGFVPADQIEPIEIENLD